MKIFRGNTCSRKGKLFLMYIFRLTLLSLVTGCSKTEYSKMNFIEIEEEIDYFLQKEKYNEALKISSDWLKGRHNSPHLSGAVGRVYMKRIEIYNLMENHHEAEVEELIVTGLLLRTYIESPELVNWLALGRLYGALDRSRSEIHEIKKLGDSKFSHSFRLTDDEFSKMCRGELPIYYGLKGDAAIDREEDLKIPGG